MTRPREILTLAEVLSKASGQAAQRSAISRAYYSVFHHIGQKLDPGKYNDPSGSVHAQLLKRLLSEPPACDPDVAEAKLIFATMRSERSRADYELDNPIAPIDAEMAIKRAKKVFAADGQ
jgi:hypothetical protein